MSKDGKVLFQSDDTISTEEDIPGSSISFSIGDNSIRVKEKPKPQVQKSPSPPPAVQKKEQWWLKKPITHVELSTQNKTETKKAETPVLSPDVNSSMKDFLDKEKMCKNNEMNIEDKNDTLENILASVAFDKCQSDFENGTDEDIENILEEMSKIAGAMSPVQDSLKSKSINEIFSEEEHSVEKLLQEAEKLVQENGNNLMTGLNTTEIVTLDDNDASEGLTRVRQLEVNIFKMIEQQTNDNISVNNDKQRSLSPSIEVLLAEDTQKTLESQKKKFEEQKVEVSSSSDLDDPIERHSMSEEINDEEKSADKKENLKKEITDVDKDFFDALLMKTKENAEQLSSHSSSFDKEDFTNFLKLLQEQSDKETINVKNSTSNLGTNQFDSLKETSTKKEKIDFMEKELVSVESKKIVYELESPICQPSTTATSKMEKLLEESLRKDSSRKSSRDSSKKSSASSKSLTVDTKKGVNNKNELYTVGLTPRLELFADAIPKLLAEKTNEINFKKDEEEKSEKSESEKHITPKSEDNEDFSFKNFKALDVLKHTEVLKDHKNVTDVKDFKDLMDFKASQIVDHQRDLYDFNYLQDSAIFTGFKTSNNHLKTERVVSAPETETLKETFIGKSRSYDQFSKPTNKFSSSLENIRHKKVIDNRKTTSANIPKKTPTTKTKIQSKTVTKINTKTKVMAKSKKEPAKILQNNFSLDVKGSQIRPYQTVRNTSDGADWKGGETLEMLYQEERQRFLNLKAELEAEVETYKLRLKDVQMLHEQEMFALKKQNILLKSKVDELAQLNKVKPTDARLKYDPKMISMQRELDRQENLIRAYEYENKKLMQETKQLQIEMKAQAQQKLKVVVADNANSNQLQEKLKDLQEESFKLNLELSNLRQKNGDLSLKYEDVTQQNSLLQEELEMIKDQLRAKNDFITDRLQAMTTNELELRKQVEDLKVDLHSKTEQLKCIKVDYDRFQESVAPLEKEVDILRAKCTHYQEKLQTAKNNCEREKHLTQKLKDQVILDNKNIMDLNRQVREMERILKRKNPDSVSALILTANSENEKLSVEKVKLLEERIAFLESEIRSKEDIAQGKLTEIQRKFANMKEKYSMQVADLEHRLKSTPRERERDRTVYAEIGTQTLHTSLEANLTNKAGPKSQNPKEDTHLLATIRGLKLELVNKEKAATRVNKELQELQKTNRRLQKERERLLNERKNASRAMFGSDSKLASTRGTETYDPNSNLCPNGHLQNGKKISTSTQRLYNDSTENGENNARVKRLSSENEVLKEELSRLDKDFVALKNKRLQDLNLLQAEHEKEIALITEEYSVKTRDNKALKLQGQVNSQMAMISRLKQQIETLEDYKEQVIILKAERDHLEVKNRTLNEKVKYLSTPSSQQLQLLQEKITILQQRHESRELSLQKLVRDLLRSRSQGCRDCKSVVGGKQQLCYFRQELDNILGTLQDLTSP